MLKNQARILQESLNALKNILKEMDAQEFEKALEKKDVRYIFMIINKLMRK